MQRVPSIPCFETWRHPACSCHTWVPESNRSSLLKKKKIRRPISLFTQTDLLVLLTLKPFIQHFFSEHLRSLDGFLSCMDKDHHLMPFFHQFGYFVEACLVHSFIGLYGVCLPFDTDEMLFQRYRSEATIEEEESLVWIHPTRDYVLVDNRRFLALLTEEKTPHPDSLVKWPTDRRFESVIDLIPPARGNIE